MSDDELFDDSRLFDDLDYEHVETDLEDIIRNLGAARLGMNGEQLSELVAEARLRRSHRAKRSARAPNVQINPLSAGKGTLGNTVSVRAGLPPLPVVNWNADDDSETTVMTIAITPLLDPLGNYPAINVASGVPRNRPFAEVKFGSRAAPAFARVDVGKGRLFSVAGSFVAVNVGLDFTTGSDTPLTVSGWLGFFSAHHTAPVIRTVYVDSLAASGTSSFTIPAFATQMLPPQRTPLSNQFTLDFYDTTSTLIYTIQGGATADSFMTTPLPLSDDSYSITVTNNGSSTLTIRIPFELSL